MLWVYISIWNYNPNNFIILSVPKCLLYPLFTKKELTATTQWKEAFKNSKLSHILKSNPFCYARIHTHLENHVLWFWNINRTQKSFYHHHHVQRVVELYISMWACQISTPPFENPFIRDENISDMMQIFSELNANNSEMNRKAKAKKIGNHFFWSR